MRDETEVGTSDVISRDLKVKRIDQYKRKRTPRSRYDKEDGSCKNKGRP